MKSLINKIGNVRLLAFLLAFCGLCVMVSCQDDEGGGGIPVIHYLRVTNPELADSTFTDVNPGTMIVVVGENLDGVMKVFINDQEVSFNSNYNTSTSLILTVPAELELTGANPELKGELRIETSHGTAVFPMHVLSPAPVLTRISTQYPVNPGDEVTLIGENFYEIKRIVFTDSFLEDETESGEGSEEGSEETVVEEPEGEVAINVVAEVTDYEVSEDFTEITFAAPATLLEEGHIVVECYTSSAIIEFRRNGPAPVITAISSTMPVPGSEVTITGQNFIDVSSININGEVEVPAEDIKVSAAFDKITFIMPQAPSQSGHISVTAIGGTTEAESVFYPLENVVIDYDGVGSFSWGGITAPVVADGSASPFVSSGTCYSLVGQISAWNYWWGQIVNNAQWVSTDIIPGNTQIANMELQFECYVGKDYNGSVIQIVMGGNWDYNLTGYKPVSSFTGTTEIGKWMQCSIPLSSIVAESTYQDFLNRGNVELGVYMTNPTETANDIELYFDNFRLVKK